MTDLPIMPVYVERLLADTDHLTNEEFGAYTRLLFGGWLRKGVLEVDDLPRLAHESRQRWPALWRRLAGFFCDRGDGKVGQKMLTSTYENAMKNRAANRARTAKARAEKAKKNKRGVKNDRAATEPVTKPVTDQVTAPVATSYPNKRSTLPYQAESTSFAERGAAQVARSALEGRSLPSPAPGERMASEMADDELQAFQSIHETLMRGIGSGRHWDGTTPPSRLKEQLDANAEDAAAERGGDRAGADQLPQPQGAAPGDIGAEEAAQGEGEAGEQRGEQSEQDEQVSIADESPLMRALRTGRKP